MIKLIKRQSAEEIEPVITIEYSTWSDELESISNLIESKQSYIVGFGENKEMYQIKIDNILYSLNLPILLGIYSSIIVSISKS